MNIEEIDKEIKRLQAIKKSLQDAEEEAIQAPFKKRLGPAYDVLHNINGFGDFKMNKICSLKNQTKESLIKEFPLLRKVSDEQFTVILSSVNVS